MQMWTNTLTGLGLGLPRLGESYVNSVGNNYDQVPGSFFGDGQLFEDLGVAFAKPARALFPWRSFNFDYTNLTRSTFVPTVSSIDFQLSGGPKVRLADYNLSKCAGTTPFDQAYVGNASTDHVAVNSVIANFFRSEIYSKLTTSCGPTCDFNVGAVTPTGNNTFSCNASVQLLITCSGANCDNVNYSWSGNGLSASVPNPTFNAPSANGTYTYTVTASRSGCNAKTATINISVSGCGGGTPTNTCIDYSPQCSGNIQEIAPFQLNVATPGRYPLTISYRSQEKSVDAVVRVNGESQTVRFNQTGVNTYATVTTASFNFNANNTVGISSGNDGGYICVNRLCLGGDGGNTTQNCNFSVSAAPNDGNTNRSCGSGVTLNANCSGTNCDNISYSWSGNGLSASGASTSFNVPTSNGSYTYTVIASRPGCSNQTATTTVNVNGCSDTPAGSCTTFSEVCSGNDQEIQPKTINVASQGNYSLTISYKSSEKAIATSILVDNSPLSINYNQVSGYTTATTGSIFLSLGTHTIGLRSGSQGGYICFNSICVGDGGGNTNPTNPQPPVSGNPTNGSYEGYFDGINCSSAYGWVWNSSYPNQPINVQLLEGSTVIATTDASNYRTDLQQAGKGNGQHGFSFNLPSSLRNGQNHDLSVRVTSQGFVLYNSPKLFNCPSGARIASKDGQAKSEDEFLVVWPNPTEGHIRFRFFSQKGELSQVQLVDIQGRILKSVNVTGMGSLYEQELLIPEATTGLILLQLKQGNRIINRRIIVRR
ncbi:hypothetical protein GCM10027578_32210 [Spirosoma luteolum]